jgi:translation initiation factor IF-3
MARVGDGQPSGELWLFDGDGIDLGFMLASEAAALARERGLDLVRLDDRSSPPRYGLRDAVAAQAAAARAGRIAHAAPAKEIRVRVATGTADLETRRKQAADHLAGGYRVKLRVELDPGRRSDPLPARTVLDSLVRSLSSVGLPEAKPQSEKGAVTVTLAPR